MNWNYFIAEKFGNDQHYVLKSEDVGGVLCFTVKSSHEENDSYIQLEVDKLDPSRILGVEFGSQDSYIMCKGVIDFSKEFGFKFIQTAWLDSYDKSNELQFSEINSRRLLTSLRMAVYNGWSETHFYSNGDLYKVGVAHDANGHRSYDEIIVQSFAEQDLPLFPDSLLRKLRKLFIDLFVDEKKKAQRSFFVQPLIVAATL